MVRARRMNMVHTLNMVHLRVVPDDRRERTRQAKRARILMAAGGVIDRDGYDGLTMQAVAAELDCAVGTLYTAFASKSELVASLQSEAVGTLEGSLRAAHSLWEPELELLEPELASLVRLVGYAGFVGAAGVVYPDETQLVRAMLGDAAPPRGSDQARALLPVVMRLLDPPVGLLADAVGHAVLVPADPVNRALGWLTALHGVLRVDALSSLDRHLFRSAPLARSLTVDLLCGWGASRDDVEIATSEVDRLGALGPLAPPPDDAL
jgi:AcrR family transcriptional regulator